MAGPASYQKTQCGRRTSTGDREEGARRERRDQDRVPLFRATGITEYLRIGGKLEMAQRMANHESSRSTGLYDGRHDQVSLDKVGRIMICRRCLCQSALQVRA